MAYAYSRMAYTRSLRAEMLEPSEIQRYRPEKKESPCVQRSSRSASDPIKCKFTDADPAAQFPCLRTLTIEITDPQLLASMWHLFPVIYRYRVGERTWTKPTLLQKVFNERGWVDYGDGSKIPVKGAWNLWWKCFSSKDASVKLEPWQRTNHLCKAPAYCRKDVLARNQKRLNQIYQTNSIYDFCPISYNLPGEFTEMLKRHRRRIKLVIDEKPLWIAKPIGKSQGKGIVIFDNPSSFTYDEKCVVQEYLSRPYLIDGYKWDLRIYVAIPCTNPLTIYAYREGITRFATNRYDLKDLGNIYSHLTNTSLNKGSPFYKRNKSTIGVGSKWTFKMLREYIRSHGVQDYFMWQRIWSVLVLTILGDGKNIVKMNQKSNSCFEFLGFDILVDENLKPHLLEVNTNPSLSSDIVSGVDESVKKPMLHELFDLLGLPNGKQFYENCDINDNQPCPKPRPYMVNEDLALKKLKSLLKEQHPSSAPARKLGMKTAPTSPYLSRIRINSKDYNNNNDASPFTKSSSIKKDLKLPTLSDLIKNDQLLRSGFEEECTIRRMDREPGSSARPQTVRRSMNFNQYTEQLQITSFGSRLVSNPLITSNDFVADSLTPKCTQPIKSVAPTKICLPALRMRETGCYEFAKNGPGVHFPQTDWTNPPNKCGNWIRIFPFDVTTQSKSSFSADDSSRVIVNQVNEYIRAIKAVEKHIAKNPEFNDADLDFLVEKIFDLNTDIWHPPF